MIASVSSGLDSVVMLYKYPSQINYVLSFIYGSRCNSQELPGRKIAFLGRDLGVELEKKALAGFDKTIYAK